MKKAFGVIGMLGVVALAMPSSAAAQGSLYHARIVSRSAGAFWTSCPGAAVGERCTYTFIEAEQISSFGKDPDDFTGTANDHSDCVYFAHSLGVKTGGLDDAGLVGIWANSCGAVSVNVPASLVKGHVEGELPAQRCDLTTYPETCVDTTLRIALDWLPSGDVFVGPNSVDRVIYPADRCLYHTPPDRGVFATVTGEIDGLAGALGETQEANISKGGETWVGTNHGCLD
jgi:hypothetical protein